MRGRRRRRETAAGPERGPRGRRQLGRLESQQLGDKPGARRHGDAAEAGKSTGRVMLTLRGLFHR